MANHEADIARAKESGDAGKVVEAYESYKESMERSGQTVKPLKDL